MRGAVFIVVLLLRCCIAVALLCCRCWSRCHTQHLTLDMVGYAVAQGNTTLALACASGDAAAIEAILNACAWSAASMQPLLYRAVETESTEVLEVLLAHGADLLALTPKQVRFFCCCCCCCLLLLLPSLLRAKRHSRRLLLCSRSIDRTDGEQEGAYGAIYAPISLPRRYLLVIAFESSHFSLFRSFAVRATVLVPLSLTCSLSRSLSRDRLHPSRNR